MNDSSYKVRMEACKHIRNENVLLDVLLNDSNMHVREEACEGIHNKEMISEHMLNHPDYKVRIVALKRIDDEDVIHEYGTVYGFRTLKVLEPDPDWADKILVEARRIHALEEVNR